MEHNFAYQIGQVIGGLVVLAVIMAVPCAAIACLVMAIRSKKTGWIVATVVLSLPVVAMIVLIGFFFVAGVVQAVTQQGGAGGANAPLLTAPMTEIEGKSLPYKISLPAEAGWREERNENSDADYVWARGSKYVMVIAEKFGVGDPESLLEIARVNMEDAATDIVMKEAVPMMIDGRRWLRFDVEAKVSGTRIYYRYYVYGDTELSIQIITFTTPGLFANTVPVFDRIASSFKFPPKSAPAATEVEPESSGQSQNPG